MNYTNIFSQITKIILTHVLIFLLSNCKKDEADPVINEEVDFADSIDVISIENPGDAIQRIRFLYEHILFRFGFYWLTPGSLAGITHDTGKEEFIYFENFSHDLTTVMGEGIWDDCYRAIHLSNLYLSEVDSNPDIIAASDYYVGQVYFYRALSYFTLLRLFGEYYPGKDFSSSGVVILSTDVTMPMQRASVGDVYDLIINDLDNAAMMLPAPNSAGQETTKYSAMALAAYMHMWFQNYNEAEVLLNNINQSGNFALLEDYAFNFDGHHENSTESLFEFQFDWNGYHYYSGSNQSGYLPAHRYTYMIGGNEPRRFYLTNDAVAKLGDDPRASETYYSLNDEMFNYGFPVSNASGDNYVKKYAHVDISPGMGYGNNLILFRLSDIYLLYSEIQILKNNLSEAIKYMNMVRERAGVDPLSGSYSSSELMDTLRLDRYIELCGEGSYWYDCIRWELASTEFGSRGFIKGTHEVLPIPADVIESNPGILQNSGY